jgi:hypothetical protein
LVHHRCGVGAGVRYKAVLRSRSRCVRFLTATVVAAPIALAGCTFDGTTASTRGSGSIASFVRNLFGSKSGDQLPVARNEAPVEPSAPKTKSATSKPKPPAVAVAATPRAKLRSRRPTTKTVAEVPEKQEASVEPQSRLESATPPLLSGAAPTLPTGSFDNRGSASGGTVQRISNENR